MPSYHEGLPIALLEAMSYSLPAIVSNIPANLEVKLTNESYFSVGDINELSAQLVHHAQIDTKKINYDKYLNYYDWKKIAKQTMSVYNQTTSKKKS